MTTLAKGSAFALGALLYLAWEHLVGVLAATPVPKAYFEFFGTHKIIALVLEEAVLIALPGWLLSVGWGLGATRLVRGSPLRVAGWATAGLSVAWLAMLLRTWADWESNAPPDAYPVVQLLWSSLVPPVWGIPTLVSAPSGLLAAGSIAWWWSPLRRTA